MPPPTHNSPGVIETDALIVGAGPIGLFQVFQLGLLGIRAHVVDALPHAGGQCIELYPDKAIYDIPALPSCTGQELTERLLAQSAPFAPTFHWGQEVSALQQNTDGRWAVGTRNGPHFVARNVFIAAGVGAFQARSLSLDGLQQFAGTQLLHRLAEPARHQGQRVVIVGGNEAALEAAIALVAARAQQVLLVHRRDVFQAEPGTIAQVQALREAGHLHFIAGQVTGFEATAGRLQQVHITHGDAQNTTVPLDQLLVCLGLSPKLGPLTGWGLALERKQVPVNPATFETCLPGVYAVGDINTYPGKRKLIVSGLHEATLAAYAAAERLRGAPVQLQYTSASQHLQRLLGVADEATTPAPAI
jgi:thioredoxin reductase (NADPH)